MRRVARADKGEKAVRAAIQIAWRKHLKQRDRRPFRESREGVEALLRVQGSNRELATAAFAAGLLSRRQAKAFIPSEALDILVGRSVPNVTASIAFADTRAFYDSREWRQLAYKCKLRDGRRCMCCGATPAEGARIVSDHIIPIRVAWSSRLDPSNVQTLCDDCNRGKGSWDPTRFTEARATPAQYAQVDERSWAARF